ncbi:pantoate--beta-alanine ligase [Peribacillus kribbensis]|uniref:pantoate--beta-alanine ligase n=1 Tax=Peribacillus kribbensis TaxID=356658 RepID=UPI0004210F2D|nr:pantoate--beta-alanine ligase [Peribacillus kribbensis]
MKTISDITTLKSVLQEDRRGGASIGFVPTMGYLHEGHQSLMEQARKDNEIVVLSVFVNPLQFGPNEDFETYPRDIERDEKVARAAGVDYIFYPSVEEMYPKKPSISFHVHERAGVLCGTQRPGHFDGVAAVLTKLFNIVQPDRAYFGLKDAQQVAVIESLVEDFNIPVEIVPVKTIREQDGLAKSSRNVYLSEKERDEAPAIFRSLEKAEKAISEGEREAAAIRDIIISEIESNSGGIIDYIEVLSYPDLQPLKEIKGRIIMAAAVKFSRARLIDNKILTV